MHLSIPYASKQLGLEIVQPTVSNASTVWKEKTRSQVNHPWSLSNVLLAVLSETEPRRTYFKNYWYAKGYPLPPLF